MPILEITSANSKLEIVSDVGIEAFHPIVQAFLKDSDAFNRVLPLSKITVDKVLGVTAIQYDYTVLLKDTRRFYQSLLFENGVKQTFDTFGQHWYDTEFQPQRPVRLGVITLIRDFKLVKLEMLYGP